jgi:hypothetical protein
MRRPLSLVASAAVGGLVASACGGPADVLQGKSPTQIVQFASAQVSSASYNMDVDSRMVIWFPDPSSIHGISRSQVQQLGHLIGNLTVIGTGQVQDRQHLRMTLSLTPLTAKMIGVVDDGGDAYISLDRGKTFTHTGDITSELTGLVTTPDDLGYLLAGSAPLQDAGSIMSGGVRVEDLKATLGLDYLQRVLSKLDDTAMSSRVRSFLARIQEFRGGSIEMYVRAADGRVDTILANFSLGLDIGKMPSPLTAAFSSTGGRLASVRGVMLMKVETTMHLYGYGTPVQITRPYVDPNAPGLTPGELFSGSGATGA